MAKNITDALQNNWDTNLTPVDGPAVDGLDITPSDDEDLDQPVRGLWVGVSGDVRVTMVGVGGAITGATMTWPNVAAGVMHPLRVRKVWATGTTATGIKGGL